MARVLIVDDSALVRSLLTDILRSDPGIEVVGVAGDAHVAREKIKQLNPDVLTLDVEMPKMDGLTFLKNLMRLRPMPVVMVSSLTERGADVTLDALAIGAVDYLSKPKIDLAATLKDYGCELIEKIHIANKYLVPKQATEHGLKMGEQVEFTDDGLREIIHSYTREAGVRTRTTLHIPRPPDRHGGGPARARRAGAPDRRPWLCREVVSGLLSRSRDARGALASSRQS